MDIRTFLLLVLPILGAAFVAGCDGGGPLDEESSRSARGATARDSGSVNFAIRRRVSSSVPSSADSAFVRLWQPGGDFNQKKIADVPDPGSQTEIAFTVPAGRGYRVGVMVTEDKGAQFSRREKALIAYGESSTGTVVGGDTTEASVGVRPTEVTLRAPAALRPSETDTIAAVYNINPPDALILLSAQPGSSPSFEYFNQMLLTEIETPNTDTTVVQRFEITAPSVTSRDTTYVKVARIFEPPDPRDWITGNRELARSYFPTEKGPPSFEIPVVPDTTES
ncbi:hypothetical protein, secreted (plasmid) [Salinibacter ruber M8]|uniref:Lipoprotein n=1 Tax=Salinibacter ruber (strain M8) TaxID=761659 RepID=D5H4D4_SALRM|nr:hypothetical protein, secreted [Salinibacter ruber M8]